MARTKRSSTSCRQSTNRAPIRWSMLKACWRRKRRFPASAIACTTPKIRAPRTCARCPTIWVRAVARPSGLRCRVKIEEFVKAEKKLNANVDFYSASTYHILGIDVDLFTPVFAVSRISGWTAHVIEQLDDNRLIRPRADYIGPSYPAAVCACRAAVGSSASRQGPPHLFP